MICFSPPCPISLPPSQITRNRFDKATPRGTVLLPTSDECAACHHYDVVPEGSSEAESVRGFLLPPGDLNPLVRCDFAGHPMWCPARTEAVLRANFFNPQVPEQGRRSWR